LLPTLDQKRYLLGSLQGRPATPDEENNVQRAQLPLAVPERLPHYPFYTVAIDSPSQCLTRYYQAKPSMAEI